MSEIIDYLQDRWEWDPVWRDQIVLALIIGSIGLAFAYLESRVRVPA